MAATAGLDLLLPWSELGSLGIHFVAPILLGIIVAWLYADRSIRARLALLCGLVLGVALARMFWEAIVLNGGDWHFDGERILVAVSAVIQLSVSSIACIVSWCALKRGVRY